MDGNTLEGKEYMNVRRISSQTKQEYTLSFSYNLNPLTIVLLPTKQGYSQGRAADDLDPRGSREPQPLWLLPLHQPWRLPRRHHRYCALRSTGTSQDLKA